MNSNKNPKNWRNIELKRREKDILCWYLTKNDIVYEVSGAGNYYYVEIYCSAVEKERINEFIDLYCS